MKKFNYAIVCTGIMLALFIALSVISSNSSCPEELQYGNRYKIIQPVYLEAAYYNLNDRRVSRETARAYLESERIPQRSWMAFQCEVPKGTIMTIVGSAPKVWHLPFLASRYFVRLDPDLSQGLDVILELNRGIDGVLDGLNPELFERQEKEDGKGGNLTP
ncbi:MAG: hypothetical protein JEZ10_01610 [Verrucomicrobia bacterium]|nr:hypothetical protein [Verrucomicrobiota bacterium]